MSMIISDYNECLYVSRSIWRFCCTIATLLYSYLYCWVFLSHFVIFSHSKSWRERWRLQLVQDHGFLSLDSCFSECACWPHLLHHYFMKFIPLLNWSITCTYIFLSLDAHTFTYMFNGSTSILLLQFCYHLYLPNRLYCRFLETHSKRSCWCSLEHHLIPQR